MDPFTIMALVMMVMSVVYTAFFAPKPKTQNAIAGTLSNVTYPQSSAASPVPLVLGTVRLKGPNTLWYGDFSIQNITVKTPGSFFGLMGGKSQTVAYRYYVGMDLGLCLGPDVELLTVWAGQYIVYTTPGSHLETDNPMQTPHTQGQAAQTGSILSGDGDGVYINLPYLYDGTGVASTTNPGVSASINTTNGGGGGLVGQMTFYSGSYTQSRDPYLAAKCDPNTPAYVGVSHVVLSGTTTTDFWTGSTTGYGPAFFIGTSTNLNPFNFELRRLTNTLSLSGGMNVINGYDLNPMEAVNFILTDIWGGCGLDPSYVDLTTFQAAATTLFNEGTGVSVIVDQKNTGKDVINLIMQDINGILRIDQTTGKMQCKLLRKDYVVSDLPVLDETTVLSVKSLVMTTWTETMNQVRVTFPDRTNGYQNSSAINQNMANYSSQGRLLSTDVSMPMCYQPNDALAIAARELTHLDVPLYKGQLVCNREVATTLLPGDVFVLNWPEWNISSMICRVLKNDLGTLQDGNVIIDMIQDDFGDPSVVFADLVHTAWVPPNYAPQVITTRSLTEAGYFLQQWAGLTPLAGFGRALALGAAPSTNSVAFCGYQSTDSFATSSLEANSAMTPGSGLLVNALSLVPVDPETMLDPAAGITVSGLSGMTVAQLTTLLSTVTDANRKLGQNMLMIDDEFFSFSSMTIVSTGVVTFNGIRRGLLDSCPVAHATSSPVWILLSGDPVFPDYLSSGTTFQTKVLDQTAFGIEGFTLQPNDTLTLNSRTDRPLRPRHLTADGVANPATGSATVVLAWRESLRTHSGIYWEDDATVTPETGQSYVVRVSENGGAFVEYPVASGTTTYTYAYASFGTVVAIEVYSVLGGLRSWTPARLSFAFFDAAAASNPVETDTILSYVLVRNSNLLNWQ